MRVTIRAIGKIKGDPLEEALLTYQKRLRWEVSVQEGEIKQKVSPAALQQEEAKWLLAGVPMGAFVIALDERGKGLTSPAFSALLSQKQLEGFPQFVFLMGGADGLTPEVRARADLLLSLGAMVWPHKLARVMLMEQLYRAQQIQVGHPYHRE
ncbi:MAG: 23S rRNA (pseudouridine(1915)-N(3))-methyltransferase RlmH [Alphaproteobacteria bacterium]|jgi:23S rRNA (pseudouridine1915-N3)-methyltransferase|nr:23S rRNA (pseudouridine(1915)-N(3))-methyltransferase RlmH [Alphaproteobacteria bacterium]